MTIKQKALTSVSWGTLLYQMPLFTQKNYDAIVKRCDLWLAGHIQLRQALLAQGKIVK